MSKLYLKTEYQNGQTVLTDSFFTAPLKIAKPFYRENHTEIMLMCASPGLLAGDFYDMRFEMGSDTRTVITSQSYQKLFRTDAAFSSQNVEITVDANADFCYCPFPVIPFAGSCFRSQTYIRLRENSKLIYCDAVQAGRHHDMFAFEEFSTRVQVSVEDKPVFLDHNRFIPKEEPVDGIGFFEGYSCQGLIYAYGFHSPDLPMLSRMEIVVSQCREGFCVRVFGNSADEMFYFLKNMAKHCMVFSGL